MKKRCEKAGCAMKGFAVETEKADCLGCGAELKPALDPAIAALLGDWFSDVLKEGGKT